MERGFDALQTGLGPGLLIASTVLLILIIFAGGYIMTKMEQRYRATHPEENVRRPRKSDDERR